MYCKAMVVGVVQETWFRGKRDERQVQVLNCLDVACEHGGQMKQTFDYTPSQEESGSLDLSKLLMQSVYIGITDISVGGGGRLKLKGSLDLSAIHVSARLAAEAPAAKK